MKSLRAAASTSQACAPVLASVEISEGAVARTSAACAPAYAPIDQEFLNEVSGKSTLEKREALIQEVRGLVSHEVSDDLNILISLKTFQNAFDASEPVCKECFGQLDLVVSSASADTGVEVKCCVCDNVQSDNKAEAHWINTCLWH